MTDNPAKPTSALPATDGRRERSRSSRSRIVAAMLDVVGGGEVSPSAVQVAEAAGVGLRTVFRHFNDMDTLYREMGEVIEARVIPLLANPLTGVSWKDHLRELAARRAKVFEILLPFRVSAGVRRFDSRYLMQDYQRLLRLERETLEAHLPDTVRNDAVAAAGLNVILSFSSWQSLRNDQQLSMSATEAVIRQLLDDALRGLPDR